MADMMMMNFWDIYRYRLLDHKFPGTALKTVAKKVVLEQGVMTPILLAAFFIGDLFPFKNITNFCFFHN